MAATLTNPIWFIKTRMQLDSNTQNPMTIGSCIKQIYQKSGFWGFYKGISASYVGISETVIHFVIYEALKAKMVCKSIHILRYQKTSSIIFFFAD